MLLQINSDTVFALNFSQEYKIEDRERTQSINDEQHYHDFAQQIGVTGYEGYAMPNFSHRLIQALPSDQNLTPDQVRQTIARLVSNFNSKEKGKVP